ncbi:MAG TPA: 2-succinyl-5-enolpyruvyl-6-hydroxy-3-cyclohexene-1-carboxylic-acid synthase [Actinomycetales bacterium]|nr:2-succinyl-5-enolpyruvyl-6-hydroxy-3-cyclohexene-1-carboxylic-acid synthase [Actinomycetales bacterium]
MNPSTTTARAAVSALLEAGVRHVVLCPGSRSAPLAYALHAAESAGLLRLHVRHDERSAGFVGLGIGKVAPQAPAAVVTTSGTAVANLHPAVLEAHHSAVPLIVLSADRPAELRGTWANQTTDLQAGVFGQAVRCSADVPAGSPEVSDVVEGAVRRARAERGGAPGPVHVNVAFADPLTPDVTPDDEWSSAADGSGFKPTAPSAAQGEPLVLEQGPRTVVLAGDGAGPAARDLADGAGWPLLAEPSSGARSGPNAVGPYRLLLELPAFGGRVERVVAFGRPTLSRPVTRLLEAPEVEVVLVGEDWEPGPGRSVRRVQGVPTVTGQAEESWLKSWTAAGRAAQDAVDSVLGDGALSGPLVAREVWAAAARDAGSALVIAASNPIRDVDLAGQPGNGCSGPVLANRGLSGIDGTVSTAVGVASCVPVTRALVGDLAFLHDLGGLAVPAEERDRLNLQIVVLNDDGGGIFGLLEHGEPSRAGSFERVFGTPHGADLGSLCRGLGVPHEVVEGVRCLRERLGVVPNGLSVLEVRADRSGLRELHSRIRESVRRAVAELA